VQKEIKRSHPLGVVGVQQIVPGPVASGMFVRATAAKQAIATKTQASAAAILDILESTAAWCLNG